MSLSWLRSLPRRRPERRPRSRHSLSRTRLPRLEWLEDRYVLDVEFAYAFRAGGAFHDTAAAVVTDEAGNAYITGHLKFVAVDMDPGTGVALLPSATPLPNSSTAYLAKYNANGELLWARKVAEGSSDLGTQGYDVAIDAAGNLYVVGIYSRSDFDPGPGTFDMCCGSGFVAKYDNAGNFVWARDITTTAATYTAPSNVAVDAVGNVLISGSFYQNVSFRTNGVTVSTLTGVGSTDIFLAKLDTNGTWQWANRLGSTLNDLAQDIVADANGNLFVTGYFEQTIDMDPGPGITNLTSSNRNIFVAKYDAAGALQWARQSTGGSANNQGQGIALDPAGNVLVTGSFALTADFDPSAATANLVSSSGSSPDIFAWKLSPAGNYVWARAFGSPTATDRGVGVATDVRGSVYLTGTFGTTADFNPGAGVFNLTSAGSDDVYAVQLDASGNFGWAKRLGGSSGDIPGGLAVTPGHSTRRVFVAGLFQSSSADFDPSAASYLLACAGQEDLFVVQLYNPGPVASAGGPYVVPEGSSTELTAAGSTDPSHDIVSYTWDLDDDGQYDDATGITATFQQPQGSYPVRVRIEDTDGAVSTASSTVTVTNLPPVIASAGDVTVSEGQTATASGTWSDPGLDDVALSASVGSVTRHADGTWTWSYATTDGPEDTQEVTITATDSDGATSSTTFQLTVDNVAATISSDGDVTVLEGQTATASGTWSDPGLDDVTLSASVGSVTRHADGTWTWSYATTDGPEDTRK
ncbi:MAG: SBBP repeat-containing protein [Pirellulales bacterium]